MVKVEVIVLVISITTFIFVINKIRIARLRIIDSISWILWSFVLVIFALFPDIPLFFSKLLGFKELVNFIYTLFIFFLYILLFNFNVKISKLEESNNKLIQKIAIDEHMKRNKERK